MQICNFPGARTIGPPRAWDADLDGECGTIFVTDAVDTLSGMNIMYTVYKPTAEDLEALNNGGVLRLGIMGSTHPVFNMCVLGPSVAAAAKLEPKWDLGPPIHSAGE
jgi:hypothetical protein